MQQYHIFTRTENARIKLSLLNYYSKGRMICLNFQSKCPNFRTSVNFNRMSKFPGLNLERESKEAAESVKNLLQQFFPHRDSIFLIYCVECLWHINFKIKFLPMLGFKLSFRRHCSPIQLLVISTSLVNLEELFSTPVNLCSPVRTET